jgi:hypothetical protein
MPPTTTYFAGPNHTDGIAGGITGSGLGFYGDSGFGASVQVGAYQGRTYITSAAGTALGPECNNVKYLDAGSGILGQSGSGLALTAIPNAQATLNLRFTNDTAVQVVSAQMVFYDRVARNNSPSGVTTRAVEIRHPDITQVNNGSGATSWSTPAGSAVLSLATSPGTSGLRPNGPNTSDSRHDWYIAISCSPDSVGAKSQYGMLAEIEYL